MTYVTLRQLSLPGLGNRSSIQFCPFFTSVSGSAKNHSSGSRNTVEGVINDKYVIHDNSVLNQLLPEVKVASLEAPL